MCRGEQPETSTVCVHALSKLQFLQFILTSVLAGFCDQRCTLAIIGQCNVSTPAIRLRQQPLRIPERRLGSLLHVDLQAFPAWLTQPHL